MRIDSAELSPKDDDVLGCVEWALDISFLGEFSLSPSAFLLRPLSESFFKLKMNNISPIGAIQSINWKI